jgi:hypothetical protein
MSVKKLLAGLGIIGGSLIGFGDETQQIWGYIKGVQDTLNFVNVEVQAPIPKPKKKYWLVLKADDLADWKVVSLSSIIKAKTGYYPLWVYNINTYERFLILDTGDNPERLKGEINLYKKIYPDGDYMIIKVVRRRSFKKVVNYGICRLPKVQKGEEGIISALDKAINIASEMGDDELKAFIESCKGKVMDYFQIKEDTIK